MSLPACRRTVAFVLGTTFILAGCTSTPAKGSPDDVGGARYVALEAEPDTTVADSAAQRADHHITTAFVILMENHDWSEIEGNRSAPYINDVVLPAAASAENYFDNPKAVHPSEPNYVWLEAGDNLAILDDDGPQLNYRTTKKHLVTLLQTAEIPWKSYQQGIDGRSCPLDAEAHYAPKHNPMIFFSDVTDGNNPTSTSCISHVRPEAELATDLANGSVSGYVFITPDLCNDMHDDCASGDSVKNGDSFLAAEIPKIRASAAYKDGGAIFITWDESEDGEHPIGMLVLSPFARGGYRSTTAFNHGSLLRTIQEVFAVGPLLRGAASAPSLAELFTSYP